METRTCVTVPRRLAGLPSVGGRPVSSEVGSSSFRSAGSRLFDFECRSGVMTVQTKEKAPRPEKVAEVEELRKILQQAKGAIFADYRGLNVKTMSTLRKRLRESDAGFRVVKNTLVKRAAQGLPAEKLVEGLEGPTAVAYTETDPVSAAKALTGFIREFRLPKIKGGIAEGHVMGPDDIQVLAAMPPRPVLLAQVVSGLQGPIASLVGTLQQLYGNFVYTLQGVADKRASSEKS